MGRSTETAGRVGEMVEHLDGVVLGLHVAGAAARAGLSTKDISMAALCLLQMLAAHSAAIATKARPASIARPAAAEMASPIAQALACAGFS